MKKTSMALATAASLFLIAGPTMATENNSGTSAGAQAQTQGQAQTGQGQDLNASGQASVEANQSFDDLDRNRDGNLDQDELNTFGSTAAGTDSGSESDRGERNMEFYDQDQNDSVSRDEFDSQNRSSGSGGSMGSGNN